MKIEIVQPYYSMDVKDAEECFKGLLYNIDQCTEDADIIVLPEYSDTPTAYKTKEEFDSFYLKYNGVIMEKAKETAIRCKALVFVNALCSTESGNRNTTFAISEKGEVLARYFKAHPAPSEVRKINEGGIAFDVSYSYEQNEPFVFEYKGVRYGFMTCYDFYFYESFAPLARKNVDIIIGCSHQRTDTHQALEIIGRFLSYNTNAYLVRASVSLGETSEIGGSSMVVAPDGTMLANMKSKIGICRCEIEPEKKYYKPAGFGGEQKPHYVYIEEGRRPWNYRPAGSAICVPDNIMGYPRVCAHRGFNTIAPENSMPAFGAAVAMGAEEIEFDLRFTKDGEIVSVHDNCLDRVSNGTGYVEDYTYEELLKLDFGAKAGDEFKGLKITAFEDILKKFSCHTIMNIHIKTPDYEKPLPTEKLEKIVRLIDKYDCRKYVYFMCSNEAVLKQLGVMTPDITRCVGASDDPKKDLVEAALRVGAGKIQLFKPHFEENGDGYVKDTIEKAHKNGIICNIFFADDPDEAEEYLRLGADVILTNDYNRVAKRVKEFIKKETE